MDYLLWKMLNVRCKVADGFANSAALIRITFSLFHPFSPKEKRHSLFPGIFYRL